jgi:nucleotide-binding universal stress UspA family protein
MLRYLAEQYGRLWWGAGAGETLGVIVGIVVGLLLLSAVNTAIGALIGLYYMMARDGEMPKAFARLNRHGVPWLPLSIAVLFPVIVVWVTGDFHALTDYYAIGVVGAIVVNLGSCTFNRELQLRWWERVIMGGTTLFLFAIELTIAKTKPDALFFALCVVGSGLGMRFYGQKKAGLQTLVVHKDVAAAVSPEVIARLQPRIDEGQRILVAVRGLTPVIRYALEEAQLRKGPLYVLYVKELAVAIPGVISVSSQPRWQDDSQAAAIMYGALDLSKKHQVSVVPLYAVSEDPASTIIDLAATLGIDILMLGASNRRFLTQLMKGDIATEVARDLPENIQLLIYG